MASFFGKRIALRKSFRVAEHYQNMVALFYGCFHEVAVSGVQFRYLKSPHDDPNFFHKRVFVITLLEYWIFVQKTSGGFTPH